MMEGLVFILMNKKIKLILYTQILFVFLSCGSDFHFYLKKAEEAKNKNKYNLALKYYNKAIQEEKNNAIGYAQRGILFFDHSKYTNTIKDFSKAIKIMPEFHEIYFYRAIAYVKIRDFYKAIKDYRKVIALAPLHYQAYINLGQTYEKVGNYDKARLSYTSVIQKCVKNVWLGYFHRARFYLKLKKYNKSLSDMNKARNAWVNVSDLDKASLYYFRGLVYEKLKQHPLAQKDWETADKKFNTMISNEWYIVMKDEHMKCKEKLKNAVAK